MKKGIIKDSRIFITGGAGFVGSYLVEQLLERKPAQIIILDNLIRGSLDNMRTFIKNPVVKFIEGDIRDERVLNECMSQSEYCFHMAALRINACAADQREGFEVMFRGTFNVIEAAKKHAIKKLIYSSSASVYGMAEHFPTPEKHHPYDNKTFYGAAKLFGEQLLRSYAHMHGLSYVALRYFNVYGPRMDKEGKYTEVMIKWLDCIREGKKPRLHGDGSSSMDFIYVEDVARANILALESEAEDMVFNIGSKSEVSLKQLLTLILQVNDSSLEPETAPENKVNPVARRMADVDLAKRNLGFLPSVNLSEGLRRLSKWYFDSQSIKR